MDQGGKDSHEHHNYDVDPQNLHHQENKGQDLVTIWVGLSLAFVLIKNRFCGVDFLQMAKIIKANFLFSESNESVSWASDHCLEEVLGYSEYLRAD